MNYYDIYIGKDKNRFAIGRKGTNNLLIICANPSEATIEKPDRTMKRIEYYTYKNGFDGFIVVNLYPLKEKYFNNLPMFYEKELHKENLSQLQKLLSRYKFNGIWAAWGNLINERTYLPICLLEIINKSKLYNYKWYCCNSLTVMNNPRHPSRLSNNASFNKFDIESYVKSYI